MHTSTLSALVLLAATSQAIDINGVASDVVGAFTSQATANPMVSAASSYGASASTQSGYVAATQYLATAAPSSQALAEQSSYFKVLETATGSVPQPSYYSNLPSSVRTELDAYGSGVSSAAKAAQTTLVFSNGNSTLGGTNGTMPGASGSGTGGSSGIAPGQGTVTSTSTTDTGSMTTSTSSSSSSSSSPTSSSSKGGAASQPTGVYKAAGAAAVGALGLAALL